MSRPAMAIRAARRYGLGILIASIGAASVAVAPVAAQPVMSASCAPRDGDKVAAQVRRWITEWAGCLERSGYGDDTCLTVVLPTTVYPVDFGILHGPNDVRLHADMTRVLEHAEDKFKLDCTLSDWQQVWTHIPGAPPCPPDGPDYANFFEPGACYADHYVKPQHDELLAQFRSVIGGGNHLTPRCAAETAKKIGYWIRDLVEKGPTGLSIQVKCYDERTTLPINRHCGANTATPQITQPEWNNLCNLARDRFLPMATLMETTN